MPPKQVSALTQGINRMMREDPDDTKRSRFSSYMPSTGDAKSHAKPGSKPDAKRRPQSDPNTHPYGKQPHPPGRRVSFASPHPGKSETDREGSEKTQRPGPDLNLATRRGRPEYSLPEPQRRPPRCGSPAVLIRDRKPASSGSDEEMAVQSSSDAEESSDNSKPSGESIQRARYPAMSPPINIVAPMTTGSNTKRRRRIHRKAGDDEESSDNIGRYSDSSGQQIPNLSKSHPVNVATRARNRAQERGRRREREVPSELRPAKKAKPRGESAREDEVMDEMS